MQARIVICWCALGLDDVYGDRQVHLGLEIEGDGIADEDLSGNKIGGLSAAEGEFAVGCGVDGDFPIPTSSMSDTAICTKPLVL